MIFPLFILDERNFRTMERRSWLNFAILFLGTIVLLSVWKMNISSPDKQTDNNIVPAYRLNTINFTYLYPMHILSATDYSSLIDLTNFQYNHISNCSDTIFLLILVHSSPDNFSKRKSIRDTWGISNRYIKVLFVVGQVDAHYFKQLLEKEHQTYNDFVQGNFLDHYRNMTYKHAMSLKYAIYHCPQAKYILKTDDDVFVNMPLMLNFLNVELSPYGAQKLLLCEPFSNLAVKRSYRSKWRVSYHEFSDKYYPTYCPGWALLYSPDVLFNLYKVAQESKYFWIDDVFITGILAKQENIQHTNMKSLILEANAFAVDIIINHKYDGAFVFSPPNLTLKEMYQLWNFVNNCTVGYCRQAS